MNNAPARNRVSPLGEIVAVPGRGTWMGNRGCLHKGADTRDVVRNHATKAWIICALSFRGRRVAQWQPGRYTPLFFLDEAVAFAAGHRPCAECRRADYNAYRTAWNTTSPGQGLSATQLDEQLHTERRVGASADRRTYECSWAVLPDGTFVMVDGEAAVIVADRIAVWDRRTNAYGRHRARPRSGTVAVLTPPANVAVLGAGYPIQIDAAAASRQSLSSW